MPNITPVGLGMGEDKIAWSQKDIASFLDDGMNPAGDYAGGDMAEVIRNTSLLEQGRPRRDRRLYCLAAAEAGAGAAAEKEDEPPGSFGRGRRRSIFVPLQGEGRSHEHRQRHLLKLVSAVLFAVMSALIRYLGARYPIGEVVFFRSAFAIVPVVIVYAWRGELMAAVRTEARSARRAAAHSRSSACSAISARWRGCR